MRDRFRYYSDRIGAGIVLHRLLLANTGFLTIATGVSALLGFVFWLWTARSLSPEQQGLASAGISTINMLAFLGELGLGTLLMGRLKMSENAGGLMTAALVCSFAGSLLTALVFVSCSDRLSPQLRGLVQNHSPLFIAGVVASAIAVTVDGAAIGLLASWARMVREIIFSVLRIVFLLVLFKTASGVQPAAIIAVWIGALFVSLSCTFGCYAVRKRSDLRRPDLAKIERFSGDILGHHALNIGASGGSIALPFLVTEVLSPTANSVFYITWMFLQAAMLVPGAAATALFAISSASPQAAIARLRFSLKLSTLFGVLAAAGCYIFLQPMLGFFNSAYPAIAGSSLDWLGLSLLPIMIKYHYIAVMRLQRRMGTAALIVGAGTLLEIAAAVIGGTYAGLYGLTTFWMSAIVLQALIQLPAVLSAARWGGEAPAVQPT
ncbi:lipopolysaccharide biosynthesis protein [Hyphomicrobium sp.]|uniref:lipopolysaccharide biosynthesis protein n=1 Tax=Hyphomicrobium sp. TaxID=82 RepID=UPI002D79D431|nr:oligosaccharide flippase family protein [Hyphomicrobium sp.]HET6391061.1 oligosaccharide flippase family protein [Hyphomicrobium sp.]